VAGDRGFTLIEVLVVMLLLSIGMLAFSQGTLATQRLHRRSRGMSAALLLAQEGLERIGALGWGPATAGLPRARLPELTGEDGEHPHETVVRSGRRHLLVYAREESGPSSGRCAVSCFWADGERPFAARDVVRLEAGGMR
jgi:prepilin-type N-terminal cleavage/methylation domain-containing protein